MDTPTLRQIDQWSRNNLDQAETALTRIRQRLREYGGMLPGRDELIDEIMVTLGMISKARHSLQTTIGAELDARNERLQREAERDPFEGLPS